MATQIGSLYFQVTANTSQAYSSIIGLGGAAESSAGIISKAIGATFTAAAVAATTAIATITTGLAVMGAEFNISGQKATGLFTALTGSAEEAVNLMQQFAQLSLDTPIFSAKGLQDVSRTLLAYGVAKDDVVGLSVAINSTATALGVGVQGAERLALALGQVKARGFFSAEEARQLANYGVNAYQLIADAVGMTVSEVRQLGKEHKLLSTDVLPILTERLQTTFGPVAQNLINTFSVQVQGLKNTLTGVASALVQPFIGRTGGGAAIDFLKTLRSELDGVVTGGEDGTFKLGGALESLNKITQALADAFGEIGNSIVSAFASVGTGGIESFSNGVAAAIPKLVAATEAFASGAIDFFHELIAAAQPVYGPIKDLVLILGDFVVNALPAAADAVVNFVDAAAPIAATLIQITDAILVFSGPVLVDAIQALADAFAALADAVKFLGGPLVAIYAALGSIAFLATSSGGLGVLAVQGLALAFVSLAAGIGSAVAALATYNALKAGLGDQKGADNFLFGNVPTYEKPFQLAANFGFALGGGSDNAALEKHAYEMNKLLEEGTVIGNAFADQFKDSGLSMQDFGIKLDKANLSVEANAAALIAYRAVLDDIQAANVKAGLAVDAFAAANLFEARVAATAGAAVASLSGLTEDEIDVLKELKQAAKDAWTEVDKLLRPTTDVTIDDFFRELPKLAESLTSALAEAPGALRNLDVSGALEDTRAKAAKVIKSLAQDYGLSMEQIKSYFDERGLAGVIDALGNITKTTTKTVDPLIAKYGQLGATVDQIQGALKRLNDERQTAIKAQIDQVQAALVDAKVAAEEAKKAFDDFFKGDTGGLQGAIDKLVLDIPNVGDQIEKGLLKGGPQGEAMIRQALGGAGESLGSIFQMGLQQGLSPDEIINMLGPVYGSITQEVNGALNRISSLDWTEGFTPQAAGQIQDWFASILDPGKIGQLFANVVGSDSAVSGLQKKLDDLNAAAAVTVEFSPAQVQAAIDAIDLTTVTEVVTTPEAAKAIYDVIQGMLDDNKLEATVDQAVITQQVLDAATDAENQIHLVFDSTVAFNQAGLSQAGIDAANEFITAFNQQSQAIQDQYAQSQGFPNATAMREALGSTVTNAQLPQTPFISTVNVSNDITVNGNPSPISTATETVAAMSAAAGSGGQLSRSLQDIYGYNPGATTGPR